MPIFLTIETRQPSLTNPTIFSLRSLSLFTGCTKCEKNSSAFSCIGTTCNSSSINWKLPLVSLIKTASYATCDISVVTNCNWKCHKVFTLPFKLTFYISCQTIHMFSHVWRLILKNKSLSGQNFWCLHYTPLFTLIGFVVLVIICDIIKLASTAALC